MKYIDIHSHLHDPAFDADLEDVLVRMKDAGVGTITVGTGLMSSREAVLLAEHVEHVWATIGVHPNDDPSEEFDETEFRMLAKHPKVVGVGECGLDMLKTDQTDLNRQRELFEKHIMLAKETNLPLMLHVRDAYREVLDVLQKYEGNVRGNVHFFAGDVEIAKMFLDRGFTLSFTGVVTFARNYDEVLRYIPDDMIMVETDAPYVAPIPHRGKRNEPLFVTSIMETIATIRGTEADVFAHTMLKNSQRIFGIM